MRFCPYAQRIHLVLNAKNIPHDVVNINLKNKPEWYLEKFPLGKVPALYVDGVNLYESLIIADYLDEKYPQRPLFPKDPLRKALDRILIEGFSRVINLLYKLYISTVMDAQHLAPILEEMDLFEKELAKRGTPYFSGDEPGMVDYMIWPWCERLEMVRILGGDQFKVPKERFQRMVRMFFLFYVLSTLYVIQKNRFFSQLLGAINFTLLKNKVPKKEIYISDTKIGR